MANVSIDLNGSGPGNPGTDNTTTYNNAAATNPTVNLFSSATVKENGGGTLDSITIKPSGWSATETLGFSQPLPSGFTSTTNSNGTLTITWTGGGGGGSVSDWQKILESVTYTNSADVPNQNDYRTFTVTATGHSGTVVNEGNNSTDHLNVTCFYAGTMVRTPDGEVKVETLKRGDLVLTADGRTMPISWVGRQTISTLFSDPMRVLPIRIKAGALAENVPSRDLLVSPDHAILVEGALIQAGALVNGSSIVRERNVPRVFTYYHVELDDHSLILAENTPAETFVDNVDRLGFDNWAEHEALYPDGKHVEELPYPRAKSHRQVPVSIRVMLGARAQAIGAAEHSAVA
jgi:hypothetical protein